jgi:hypothetical protein
MQTEEFQNCIQTYTASLTPAVQAGLGARFSLLLSLISVHQQQSSSGLPAGVGRSDFSLPEASYPDPRGFYSDGLTERLNQSVKAQQGGR